MTVFVIADTLCRQNSPGDTQTRVFIRSICGADDSDEAYDVFVGEFNESEEFHQGWVPLGVPGKLDINQPEVALYRPHVPAVYIMADSLIMVKGEVTAVKVFMRTVCAAESPDAAYEQFLGAFEQSEDFHAGWQLVNAPSKLDVGEEEIQIWTEHVHSAEVLPFRS